MTTSQGPLGDLVREMCHANTTQNSVKLLGLSQRRNTRVIDREFVTSAKKFANFNEFSVIKKIRKNSYKNALNACVGVAFQ